MKRYYLVKHMYYYGVVSLAGKKEVFITADRNEAVITNEDELEDALDFLESKGHKRDDISVNKIPAGKHYYSYSTFGK